MNYINRIVLSIMVKYCEGKKSAIIMMVTIAQLFSAFDFIEYALSVLLIVFKLNIFRPF
jgi:hypothetical protein